MKKRLLVLIFLPIFIPLAHAEITIEKIIEKESGGDPKAISKADCRGLMQLSRIAWKDVQGFYPELKKYSFDECWDDPEINVLFGERYLLIIKKRYLRNVGNDKDILICYHDGPGNWKKWKRGGYQLGPEMKRYLIKFGVR